MRAALRILSSLALFGLVLVPQPMALADCETIPETEESELSPQHLVATDSGDVDVLYSRQGVSDIARVEYTSQGRILTALEIEDTGDRRPHRVVRVDGATDEIWYTLTKDNSIGMLPAEFVDEDEAATFEDGDFPMCSPVGIEYDGQGHLWVADTTIDAVHRITLDDEDPPVFDEIDLPEENAAYEGCLPQELTTAPGGVRVWFTCNDEGSVGTIHIGNLSVGAPLFSTELAGTSPHALITAPDDFMYLTEHTDGAIDRIVPGTTPDLIQCDLPTSGRNPADMIVVNTGTGTFDLWFTQTGNDRIGHIWDVQTFDDTEWVNCATGQGNNYEQFDLTDDSEPKGINLNQDDDRIWFTLAEADAVGWIDPADDNKTVECPLPTAEGGLEATNCDFPESLLMGGGGELLDATDELSPAFDPATEVQCQSITHTCPGHSLGLSQTPTPKNPST
jgi:streptogramin lyase